MLPLLSLLAAAGAPTLDCETVEATVPAEAVEVARPKGFQWEGFRPVVTLADGRTLLLRGSALEQLSRRALKRQHEEGGPDRVMQVILVEPSGKVDAVATIPRGTLLEAHRAPDGGVVIARTSDAVVKLDYIDSKGHWTGTTRLPEDPQFHAWWRTNNPLRGTATASLVALAPGRAVITHGGRTTSLDLVNNTVVGKGEMHGLTLPTVHDKRRHEVLIADRGMRLAWFDPQLERVQSEDCNACRVVGLERTRRRGADWVPTEESREVVVVKPTGDDFEVTVRGVSGKKPPAVQRRIPIPAIPEGGRFTWRLRAGPTGTALLATSATGAEIEQQVWTIGPGAAADAPPLPVPDGLVGVGENLVADGLGGLIRLRSVVGQDADEVTRAVAVMNPRTGRTMDVTRKGDVADDVWAALSNRALRDRAPDGTILLRSDGDPMMERMAPGEAVVRFERCRLTEP